METMINIRKDSLAVSIEGMCSVIFYLFNSLISDAMFSVLQVQNHKNHWFLSKDQPLPTPQGTQLDLQGMEPK